MSKTKKIIEIVSIILVILLLLYIKYASEYVIPYMESTITESEAEPSAEVEDE